MSAKMHYERHLAATYTWMVGGAEVAMQRARDELERFGLGPVAPAADGRAPRAVDLGAGFGAHAVPVARWGYDVTAVDSSEHLLDELGEQAAGLRVTTHLGDLVQAVEALAPGVDLLLCMTDTLCHLNDLGEVERVLSAARDKVRAEGRLVITLRDYARMQPGERHFICVRGDDRRIASCALEVETDHVVVHDLLHERGENGWTLRTSSYRKLRLDPRDLEQSLGRDWQIARHDSPSGMVGLVAVRQP